MRRLLALFVLLLFAAPASAGAQSAAERKAALRALERVEEIAQGRGVRSGRELTPALAALAAQRNDLPAAEQERAERLLARPTDENDDGPGSLGPYTTEATRSCTTHFCVHWVETTSDAPPDADGDDTSIPPYVEVMKATFEHVHAVENGALGWALPKSDGTLGDVPDKIDVYIQNLGSEQLYGYASVDPQPPSRSQHGYLVMENDFAEFDYDDPTDPLEVTAAHEYNHLLQYTYDAAQDDWMYEATATWAEEKVYDPVDDYLQYLSPWAQFPGQPLTTAKFAAQSTLKQYGSAIWNHWLDTRFGAETVRLAWSRSLEDDVDGGGFAPAAYDRAIRARGGMDFVTELSDFMAATAEWDASNSQIREGFKFPGEVARSGTLALNGPATPGTVNHTAFALYWVPLTSAPQLHLTGGLPPGVVGSIALIGFDTATGTQTRVVRRLDADGRVTATLDGPGRFERITAAVINADTSNTGIWRPDPIRDWLWLRDAQPSSLSVTDGTAPPEPTVTPTPTATPTVTPTVTPAPTSVRLSRSSTKLRTIARKGVLPLFARTNKAGLLSARATVDRATARRLRVGRRKTTAGTGRRTATAPARLRINVRLSRKVRTALRRQRRRSVLVRVQVSFVPADGTRAVQRAIRIRLKR
jgi:hypothetical protein